MRFKAHFTNPWRNHKPVKESLLQATRAHKYVYMSNDEILKRDKEWEKIYPSKVRQWSDSEREEIEELGRAISKKNLSDNDKQPITRGNNVDIDTGGLQPEGQHKARDIINELKRVLGDEGKVREARRLFGKPDAKSDGDIRESGEDIRADEDRRVGRLVF